MQSTHTVPHHRKADPRARILASATTAESMATSAETARTRSSRAKMASEIMTLSLYSICSMGIWTAGTLLHSAFVSTACEVGKCKCMPALRSISLRGQRIIVVIDVKQHSIACCTLFPSQDPFNKPPVIIRWAVGILVTFQSNLFWMVAERIQTIV